jgi:hypothetical protein
LVPNRPKGDALKLGHNADGNFRTIDCSIADKNGHAWSVGYVAQMWADGVLEWVLILLIWEDVASPIEEDVHIACAWFYRASTTGFDDLVLEADKTHILSPISK